VAFFMAEGVLRSGYFHFGARAEGTDPPYLDALLSELTGAGATALLFFAVIVPACRRFPVERGRSIVHLAAHAGAAAVYSITKTLLMGVSRAGLWPLAGLGSYDYGELGYRITMEAANDVTSYAVMAFGVHVFFAWQAQKERELSRARLEARLNEARLSALQGRLQPHFLFNTLNTISAVLYEDPRKADDLISRLSDLLRASLDAPERPLVSLEEELELTRRYMELMQARFGDRLRYEVSVEDDARGAEAPVFLVQPLVENAVQYAVAPRVRPTTVEVTVSREESKGDGPGPVLRIDVVDDGPGIDGEPEVAVGRGVGLANTRERLASLYGEAASIRLSNRRSGGLRVRVELPWRDAAEEPGAAPVHPEATHA
jgi:signal transduction histidine kinase